jgi:bifunctional non-homologous end joining protein LigD
MAFQRRKPAAIGVKARFPGFIEPALATSIERVPQGGRWIHEIKFDGYRVQLHIANENVSVFTRRGNDWTRRFRKIAHDAFLISASSAIIDGEVVVPAADGTTDFSVLQNELKGKSDKIAMVAFDLLYLNGYDLRKLPLLERKALLKKLIAKTAVQFSESFEVDGPEMFKHACGIGLEGVVSKVRDSRYGSGRGNDWVKKTCAQRETLPIAGFAMKENKFDGLYLARRAGKDMIYAGKSTTASTASPRRISRRVSNRWSEKRNPMPNGSRTGESGSSRPCSRKSNIEQSPPRVRCGIRFSRESVRISDGQGRV